MQKAFTMIELVFAIVVIGILAVVAVPKFAPIINTAKDAKAKATLSSVRSAISTERQKLILRGKFNSPIGDIGDITGQDRYSFAYFDGNVSRPVLDYPLKKCTSDSSSGCWKRVDATHYRYQFTSSTDSAKFVLKNNRLDCDGDATDCAKISQ